jgi:hypothetical protein
VAAMRAYNSNWNNAEAPGSFNIDQMRSSAPHGSAAPIPADIASMLGLASGARQLGPVI